MRGSPHANYGDGAQLNVTYNARLLPTRYEMSNVFLSDLVYPGYFTMGTENDYYADGRLRYARDLQDGNFDRLFAFDHVGRLRESYLAKSGSAKLSGKDPYVDNAFEVSAREVERDFRIWLEKNYGKEDPCKRLAGGAW